MSKRKNKTLSLLLSLLLLAVFGYFYPIYQGNTNSSQISDQESVSALPIPAGFYQVVRVVDGDTIVIDYNGEEEKVRFIGVDTPESVHRDASKNTPYGKIASDYTKKQLLHKTVQLEFDTQERDKYGRLLAYVYLDGQMFNKTLLAEGHAKVATFPPNVKYVADFQAIEREAQAAQRGLWQGYVLKTDGAILGNQSSKKYHLPDCQGAKKINDHNKAWFDTATEAEQAGYQPCSICIEKGK